VIRNALSKKVLDVTNASFSDGALIQQWSLDGLDQQQWDLVPSQVTYDASYTQGFVIVNHLTGKALDVTGASRADGTPIQQWTSNGAWQQQWFLEYPYSSTSIGYLVQNLLTIDKSLGVVNGSREDGALIEQQSYTYAVGQQWELVASQGATIVNRLTGKVLDVTNASTTNGALIQQWTSDGLGQQRWALIATGDGYYKILNTFTDKVLDVTGASTSNGALVQQWDENDLEQQEWQLLPTGDGYYKIVNRSSGKVLDVTGASTLNGTLIQQWQDDGSFQQQWQIVPSR
jgi:hypothetical protein